MTPGFVRLAGYQEDSILDGPGLRLVIFFQGCPYHCPGCHNPETWDFAGGTLVSHDAVIQKISEHHLLSGITLSGGEPLAQPDAVLTLIQYAKEHHLNVVLYTGSTYEKLLLDQRPIIQQILSLLDYLIDGPFLLEQKTLLKPYVGSQNQRVIDLEKTRRTGVVSLYQVANDLIE
jgi:anaerobic ribonucleoside-triphosphate reductase activating protein